MRLKVVCAFGSDEERRFLLRVSPDIDLVADLTKHLRSRFASQSGGGDSHSALLSLNGFTLIPTSRVGDILRDGDEVTVGKSRDGPPVALAPTIVKAAIQDATTASLCSPPAKKRPRNSVPNSEKTAEKTGSTAGTPGDCVSPASCASEWVDALAAKMDTADATPSPKGSHAGSLQAAKDAATAKAQELEALLKGNNSKNKPLTSAEAAANARDALKAAKARVSAEVTKLWPPAPAASSPGPAASSQSYPKAQADTSQNIAHPVLGDLEIPAGQDPETFVRRKMKTLSKAIIRQVEHYFGATNWAKDTHLRSLADENGFVPIAALVEFERLKCICSDEAVIAESMQPSTVVEVSSCRGKLRKRS